jgi:hypothetical protein
MHTHPLLGFEEEWILSASPQELGLETGVFRLPRCSQPFVPSVHGLSSNDVRARIISHVEAAGLKFRCIFTGPNSEYVKDIDGLDGIVPRDYDRQALKRCFVGAERVVAGAPMTAVTFFNGENCVDPSVCQPSTLVENHMHFQGYIVFDEPPDDMLQYHLGNQFDSWNPSSAYHRTCAQTDLLSGPDVCLWEIPGCSLPGFPKEPPALMHLLLVLTRDAPRILEIHFPGLTLVVALLASGGVLLCFFSATRTKWKSKIHVPKELH